MGFRTYTCKIARNCGGCEWLSVPYPIQLRRKQEQVESLLGDMAASCGARIDKICGVAGEPWPTATRPPRPLPPPATGASAAASTPQAPTASFPARSAW